jgi:adenylyltransferase/sulfurtransferase
MALSDAQIERYSRQIILPGIGGRGQEKLLASKVGIVGDGIVARTASLYLAGAGVGTIVLSVAPYRSAVTSLREELSDLNLDVTVAIEPQEMALDAAGQLGSCHVLLETTGDDAERRLANAVALRARRPVVVGGVRGARGWLGVFAGHDGNQPCAECWDPPSSGRLERSSAAFESAAGGVIGSLQAMETLKLLLGIGAVLLGKVIAYDAETMSFTEQAVGRAVHCPACSGTQREKPWN